MSKPYPGPYSTDANDEPLDILDPNGAIIATVLGVTPQAEATAALLGASWELLEACHKAVTVMGEMAESAGGLGIDVGNDFLDALRGIRKVIAKAEGRS